MGTRWVTFLKLFKSSFFTALLECGPGKRVDDGVDAGCLVVSICNPLWCMALNFFYCFYTVCRVWVPDSGQVLQYWVDKGFIYGVSFVFLFLIFRFLLRKPSVLFVLLVMVSMWSPNSSCPICLRQGILLCWRFAGFVRIGDMTVQFFLSFGWHLTCSISVDGSCFSLKVVHVICYL